MCGILFQFFDLEVAFVAFLFELFLEEEQGLVHFTHILFLTCNAGLFLFGYGII